MVPELEYSDARYLVSKKTVDDRALNKDVVERLRTEWSRVAAAGPRNLPRVLEIGAGLGTMITRLVDWGVIARAEWWLLDVDAEMLAASRGWLSRWAQDRRHTVQSTADHALRIQSEAAGIDVTVHTCEAELGALLTATADIVPRMPPLADLVMAHAVLDLIDVSALLPRLLTRATPTGLFWFSINYDGETILEPAHPADAAFLALYNRSMDERVRHGRPAGHSQTGRRLFGQLGAVGARVLAAGASDWVVHPDGGKYPFDEAYFLHHIIHTIASELRQHAELDSDVVAEWVALRHQQIEEGALVYIAHQLDLLART